MKAHIPFHTLPAGNRTSYKKICKSHRSMRISRILAAVIRILYRVDYQGFDRIPSRGPCLLIANHISFLDGIFIQAACKRPIRFVIDYHIYHHPFVHFFMKMHRAIPILPKRSSVKAAMEQVSQALNEGDIVMIFPEGQVTYSGALSRFRPGTEWILDRDPVPVYPVAIKGLWESIFSRQYRKSRLRYMPRFFRLPVSITCGEVIEPAAATAPHLQQVMLSMLDQKSMPRSEEQKRT